MPPPVIGLTDEQMAALCAAAHPLPAASRSAFLEHCARELAALPELGDGSLHRVVMAVQRLYREAPELTRAGIGKYAR